MLKHCIIYAAINKENNKKILKDYWGKGLRPNSDFLHVDYDAKPGPGLFRVRDANQALAECRHFGDILAS